MTRVRGGRGLARAALAAALWLGLGGWTPAGAARDGGALRAGHHAPAVDLPPGFVDETLLSGMPLATNMAWAPDGRLFLSTKDGRVLIYQNGALLPDPFVDISVQVNQWTDRGLNGMALHPDFESSPYVYLFFVYDPPDLPATNSASSPDGEGARASRLIRVTADPNNPNLALPGSEVVLLGTNSTLANMGAWDSSSEQVSPYPPAGCETAGEPVADCLPVDSPAHTTGMVRFGPDGALYVGHGDGATVPYPDPRALRSLDVDSLAGKVLRLDPATGLGYPNNPFHDGNLASNRSRVFMLGLRNPYRFAFQPGTGDLMVGDVGWNVWEELNVGRGLNFGWPCYEAAGQQGAYATAPQTQAACQSVYAWGSGAVTPPVWAYEHVPTYSGSIILGEFYTGAAFPAEYQGALFVADYAVNWIKALRFEGEDVTVSDFAQLPQDALAGPVQVAQGPDGNLYYLTVGGFGSAVHRIRYAADGNRPPAAVLSANPKHGAAPLTVDFSAAGSSDPDGQPLSYQWAFGDGEAGEGVSVAHTYTVAGTYTAVLTVTDTLGESAAAQATITPGNHAPVAEILAPASGAEFAVGQVVTFTGAGTDVEDGALSGAQLQWSMLMHHQEHVHLNALPPTSGAEGSFVWPDHGDNTWLELCLTVHDTGGLANSACAPLWPEAVVWQLTTEPFDLPLVVAGEAHQTPFELTVQVGAARTLAAPELQGTWAFDHWSHGGAPTQTITATSALMLTAWYVNTLPPVAWLPGIFH